MTHEDDWDVLKHFVSHEATDERPEVTLPETTDIAAISERLYALGNFFCTADIKGIDEDERIVEGYASTKDIDRVNEIIEPKAFKFSMDRLRQKKIKLLLEHWPPAVGRIIKGKIDSTGLWIRAQMLRGFRQAEEAWAQVQQEGLDSFSVGFQVRESEVREIESKRVRVITDLDLYEVSLVTIPANVYATASLAKSVLYGTDTFTRGPDGVFIPAHLYAAQDALATRNAGRDIPPLKKSREESESDEYKMTAEYLRTVVGDLESEATEQALISAAQAVKSVALRINKGD